MVGVRVLTGVTEGLLVGTAVSSCCSSVTVKLTIEVESADWFVQPETSSQETIILMMKVVKSSL
jgi:hypothetical protein